VKERVDQIFPFKERWHFSWKCC